ncbi:SPARC-like protein 1 isoform X2 [Myotis myotis]|uniref:SPARC n=1 Tax=Myotis myotis TaxID=51298 RepID=A0A7J8AR33_MYOMY|nr:SPARC-like protein 1 isoform X2 [Myotis myotis]KAF6389013.1 SPARC like 1 [Myotis myotis]
MHRNMKRSSCSSLGQETGTPGNLMDWAQSLSQGLGSMKTVLFFLCILGTAAAIPTNARFLSDHSQPTAESLSSIQQAELLVTPGDTTVPILGVEDTEDEKETIASVEEQPDNKAEKSSVQKLKEKNHDQSADQGLQDQEERESDLSENLEDALAGGTLDLKEDTSEPQKEKLPENIDFLAPDVSPTVDSNQQESITNTEENQEQLIPDSHHHLNRSSNHGEDLGDEENQEQDPNIPNGDEEGMRLEPSEVGTHNDNQEREGEFPQEHSTSKQEEDTTRSDDILEESSQPTQGSKMQKDEFEEGPQEQEEDNSSEEMEEETASEIKKHNQDTEWQSQEGKAGLEVISDPEEMEKKTVSEALLAEPAAAGGDDGPRHSAREDYFLPSEAFQEAERAASDSYHITNEEQRERAPENENEDASEPGESQGAKKAESSLNEDESSTEGNIRVYDVDSCMNFQCKRGHMCKADQQGKPHCVCQDPMTCPPTRLLDQVCGTDNQTYASSCHLFATKCRLEGTKKGHQLQLDYFGACKSIPTCTDFEVTQFPLRMRDWLKNILMQLYEPNPEHAGYLNEKQRNKVKKIYLDEKRLLAGDHSIDLLLRDFKKNYHMYVYPVHWQFSELDQHPMDRVLTHSELAPLRASLVPMEHCITRFFDECDPNKDKHITLKEWGHCFGIKEEDIDENLLF